MLAGDRLPVAGGWFHATVLPAWDWETFSCAGYQWCDPETPGDWRWKPPTKRKPGEWIWHPNLGWWDSLPGLSNQNRGLKAVGAYNYVTDATFEILRLAYDLKDGHGGRCWIPGDPRPAPLIDHIHRGGILQSWNNFFEWTVETMHCVPVYDWPAVKLEQLRCSMARARVAALPPKLEAAGPIVLRPAVGTVEDGHVYAGGDAAYEHNWTPLDVYNERQARYAAKLDDDDIPF